MEIGRLEEFTSKENLINSAAIWQDIAAFYDLKIIYWMNKIDRRAIDEILLILS